MRHAILLAVVLAFALACGPKSPTNEMTPAQCRAYMKVAKLGIMECERLEKPEKIARCKRYAETAIEIASAACGFIPEPEEEE